MKTSNSLIFFFALFFLPGCKTSDLTTKRETPVENSKVIINNTPRTAERQPTAPTTTTPPQQNVPAPVIANNNLTKSSNESEVSIASFDQLKTGMSYKEVARILGPPGSTSGELKTQNGSLAMYSWKGTGDKGDWNVTVRFDNGKLVNKTQIGLN